MDKRTPPPPNQPSPRWKKKRSIQKRSTPTAPSANTTQHMLSQSTRQASNGPYRGEPDDRRDENMDTAGRNFPQSKPPPRQPQKRVFNLNIATATIQSTSQVSTPDKVK